MDARREFVVRQYGPRAGRIQQPLVDAVLPLEPRGQSDIFRGAAVFFAV